MSVRADPFSNEPWHVQSIERWHFWCPECLRYVRVEVVAHIADDRAHAEVRCVTCRHVLTTLRQERTDA